MIDKKQVLKDRPAQHRYAKKDVPYTVTPIGDIAKWRKDHKARLEAEALRRTARFGDVTARLQAAMDTGTEIVQSAEVKSKIQAPSDTTLSMKRHVDAQKQRLAASVAKLEDEGLKAGFLKEKPYTTPWYTRLYNYIVDTFLKLDFNQ